MKATELMIGDLVRYNPTCGTCGRVYSILGPEPTHDNKPIIVIWCNGLIYAYEDQIEPINLTPDILKDNANGGWSVMETKLEGFRDIYHFKRGKKECVIELETGLINHVSVLVDGFVRVSIPIGTVHELQHIFRLCDMNEIANNIIP